MQHGHPYNILIAEDCPDTRVLIAETLSPLNAHIKATENGKECLDEAMSAWKDNHPYDLIMLDLQMPVMDGNTTAKLLREKGYKLPIVAMTARTSADDIEETKNAGCDAFISKLGGIKEIMAQVKEQLSRSSSKPSIELPMLSVVPEMLKNNAHQAKNAIKQLGTLKDKIQEMRIALDACDYNALHEITMKLSTFSLLGYQLFSTYIEKIQKAAKREDSLTIKKILPSLERCASGMVAGIAELKKVSC